MINRLLLILFGLVLGLGVAQAAVYRWVDEQGQVHYSDKPRGQNASRHNFAPGSVGATADRRRAAEAEAAEVAAAERCQSARDQLQQFESAASLVERSATGEERELTPEEREQHISRARARVADACEEAE